MVSVVHTAPSSPRNLTAMNITSSSFILVWEQPDPPNGLIVNYRVRLCIRIMYTCHIHVKIIMQVIATDRSDTVVDEFSTATTCTFSFDKLQPCTQYQTTVVAYTRLGPGEAAELSVTTLSSNGKSMCWIISLIFYNHNNEC